MKIDTITGSTASGDNVKIANERLKIYFPLLEKKKNVPCQKGI